MTLVYDEGHRLARSHMHGALRATASAMLRKRPRPAGSDQWPCWTSTERHGPDEAVVPEVHHGHGKGECPEALQVWIQLLGAQAVGEDGPRKSASVIGSACTPQGCNHNIRIDSATFDDTSGRWLFYVWFQNGNTISSFNLAAPSTVYNHAGPALYTLQAQEEGINEAPEFLKRNGIYYPGTTIRSAPSCAFVPIVIP